MTDTYYKYSEKLHCMANQAKSFEYANLKTDRQKKQNKKSENY